MACESKLKIISEFVFLWWVQCALFVCYSDVVLFTLLKVTIQHNSDEKLTYSQYHNQTTVYIYNMYYNETEVKADGGIETLGNLLGNSSTL